MSAIVVQTTVKDTDKGAETRVDFYRERYNGTTRHIPLNPTNVETGEWVLEQRDEGKTMKAIAAEMHVSVSTVRRLINSALLAREVEDGEWDDFVAAPEHALS